VPKSDYFDAIVIGAGPSGAVVSHTLATQGFDVLCLEQGDWVSPSDYPANKPEYELLIQQRWSHDPNVRKLPADYPLNNIESDMNPTMWSAVGGGSLVYGAHWHRLKPNDFRVKSMDQVASDWPITYEDVRPYYEAVDEFLGVSGLDGDPAYPTGLCYPQPPLPIGRVGRRAALGANELGWHWWPGSMAIPSHRTRGREPCVRYGVCEWGCPNGSKGSFDLTYWPSALKAGAKIETGARVRQVSIDKQGRANGVLWVDRNGRDHFQRSNAVVLCANGIGTARLLLLSASNAHPNGLANSSGFVGRNLMLHPNCLVTGYYNESLESWKGPAGESIYSLQFYETDLGRGHVRGAKMHALPAPGPLSALEVHRARPFDEVWGQGFHDVVNSHAGAFVWGAAIEDLPEESNRVELDAKLTDDDGIPAPKVRYRISNNTWASLRFAVDRMREMHQASGAVKTFDLELLRDDGGHLLGTARMGDDPATSVVNSYGRSHDVPNLYIADGSIFVTGGAVNPTNTIAALALRVAMNLVASSGMQEVPA
jgi:choline dehydrogenase-like flavoprotein